MPSRRIVTVTQDFNVARDFSQTFSFGFDPDEVRILQYGITNHALTQFAGLLVCYELQDFQLILCCPATSSIGNITTLTCRTSGPLSSLRFKFCITGSDAPQATQDAFIWLVLEFIKH